jgi:hypothetical protein
MPRHPTEQLAQLITQKHACLVALRDLGNRQRVLVEEEELSQLFKLLATKQQLLTLLQSLEQGLEPYRDQHPEHRHWSSGDVRARCAALAEECPGLLKEVLVQEAESERRLRERRDITESQIHAVRSAVLAREAYVHPTRAGAGNLDLSSE